MKLKIGYFEVDYQEIDDLKDDNRNKLDGVWDPNNSTIKIDSGLKNPLKKQIILHELFHAMLQVSGREDDRRNEELVDCLASILLTVMSDNINFFEEKILRG